MKNLRSYPSIHRLLAVTISALSLGTPAAALPVTGISAGGSEKGLYLGIDTELSKRELLEIGIIGFTGSVSQIETSPTTQAPITVNTAGLRLAYDRFLAKSTKQSGLFLQAGLSLMSLSAESRINLDEINILYSGIQINCNGCGTLTVRTQKRLLDVVPYVGLGWQARIKKHLLLRATAGVQYYNVPPVTHSTSKDLPVFITREIRASINKLNNDIAATSDFYPVASLTLTYLF